MIPESRFLGLPKHFWANIRLIGQQVGYTQRSARRKPATERVAGSIKVPSAEEIRAAYEAIELRWSHLMRPSGRLTTMGKAVVDYLEYRAVALNEYVQPRLMNKNESRMLFESLRSRLCPSCPLPLNKQKGTKKAPAYFTGIINMLIETNARGMPCDYDPRELTTMTRNGMPYRTLARRVDGAFPGPVNPVAIWEIKEYYYTTTFGGRVADGVYETLLDGMELEELRLQKHGLDVKHYLMIDDRFTWWDCGRSYLCRIVDMLHMGYIDEAIFGREVVDRIPKIVKEWGRIVKQRSRGRPQ